MTVIDDGEEPFQCNYCEDRFYLADQCLEHEEACDSRSWKDRDGFEVVEDEQLDLTECNPFDE